MQISFLPRFASTVHRIIISGVINPAASEHIVSSIVRAENAQAELLVIQLDTPGALMESMHKIVKAIQPSRVPVAPRAGAWIETIYPDVIPPI